MTDDPHDHEHSSEHDRPLSGPALRVKALESLLTEKGLVDPQALDELIGRAADRPVAQLDPVERAVLWIGLMELRSHHDVPRRVVIDEAVELAKEFGAQDSFRFVNAVLDCMAKELRPAGAPG